MSLTHRRGEGVICRVTVAMRLLRSQSWSDCYPILLNMQSHILLNMQSHRREATVAQSLAKRLLHHFVKYAEPQSRSDCYKILAAKPHRPGVTVLSRLRLCMIRFKYISLATPGFYSFPKYCCLETSKKQIATLCQRTSKSVLKTVYKQTDRHFRN